jgi:biotin synthase
MNWNEISNRIMEGHTLTNEEALAILTSTDDQLLELIQAAFQLRKAAFGRGVSLHLLRNVKSGSCPEDCAFCSQSTSAINNVQRYSMQSVESIVKGATDAVHRQAKRYCVVSSTRAPAPNELETICEATRLIKQQYPHLEICSSLGLLTEKKAHQLKAAGVNRFNHNLETSPTYFPSVVSTHDFEDRIKTARIVKAAGLDLCSGGIFGMGESLQDRVDLAFALAGLDVDSVPLNFLDPRPGTRFADQKNPLTPNDCLRALALFRFALPATELRIAGGRETALRSQQPLALYIANSMFTSGYLTTGGQDFETDKQMIEDAGFTITDPPPPEGGPA